jgi:ABC-type amino acid transport substrate-binding protein
LIVTPWARAMKNLQDGTVDVLFPAGENTERQKQFYYSKEPVNRANFLIYVRKLDPIKWKGLQSLDGLNIGVKRGFNYGDKWKASTHIQKQSVSTILQGFKMLDFKRLDGFAGYEINWDYVLRKANLENKYKKLPIFDYTNEYLIALKTNPRSIDILKAFDTGKQKLMANDKLHEIEKKWSEQ